VLAPAQTPPAVPERLSKELTAALANPGVKEKLARIGVDPMPLTSAQFQALIAKEIADNSELVKAAGLKPN
jgi:tripartite-type tricarboxylate transporter receptor subunit TctC